MKAKPVKITSKSVKTSSVLIEHHPPLVLEGKIET